MTSIRDSIRSLFEPKKPLPPGLYSYQTPPEAAEPYRLHLRLEPDGSGILIVNASTVLHLNSTAAEYAYHLIQATPEEQVVNSLSARYHVKRDQALQDYRSLTDRIHSLIETPDLDPEEFLDFGRTIPHSEILSAPLRLDCALTYRMSAGTPVDDAPVDRVKRELSTEEWKKVIDKAWDAGIPHLIFTGGEPTLRDDLLELLAYCETKGMVTGLLTDGLRMEDSPYLNELLQPSVGLDHLMVVFQADKDQAWTALQNLIAADLYVVIHLTLTPQNTDGSPALLERLDKMGVNAISLSTSTPELNDQMQVLRNLAATLGMRLVWDLPVPYSSSHPVALEIANQETLIEGAGKAWLYVEPDGDVLPEQGLNRVLGNFLNDPWEKIWKRE